jgi:hypothetical protein
MYTTCYMYFKGIDTMFFAKRTSSGFSFKGLGDQSLICHTRQLENIETVGVPIEDDGTCRSSRLGTRREKRMVTDQDGSCLCYIMFPKHYLLAAL